MKTTLPLLLLISCFFTACSGQLSDEELANKARKIHQSVLTIDTHNDTPMRFSNPEYNMGEIHDSRKGGGRVDFVRMKEGGLDGAFFAAFVGQGPLTDEGRIRGYERGLRTLQSIQATVDKHTAIAGLATTPAEARQLEKEGKRIVFVGMENGYPIGLEITRIQEFYNHGVRYITLCHSRNNDICDSSTDRNGPIHNGLSDFGKKVVKEMNRLGIMVDVSHMSDKSFYDVIENSKAPIIASHSSVRSLSDNPRNLDDDMIKTLAQNGGVIQICILAEYIKHREANPERDSVQRSLRMKYRNFESLTEEEQQEATAAYEDLNQKYPEQLVYVPDAVDHIDHVVKLVGIDHVGIGTDFDGGGGIEGCYDVSEMGNITLELVKRGYSASEIKKIWGGNIMRVLREVNNVAKSHK